MKIDCHTHTIFSGDGFIRIKDAVLRAKQVGLDSIAITDHDNIKAHKQAIEISKRYNFPLILGCEIKTLSGDLLALNIKENIRPKMTLEDTISAIHDLGGLAVAAHPFAYLMYHRGIGKEITTKGLDAVEAFNARTFIGNGRTRKIAIERDIPMTAGSDAHTLEEIGNAYTCVDSDNIDDALEDIRKGRTTLSGTNIKPKSIFRWYSKRARRLIFLSAIPV